ncbi:myb-like protein X [Hylaeus volcanicus]|uniref:myb-like protein X n=1 Tax=Hylaeus volcanicus TaxID=313075 RepID=UPI0023B8170F|nr:myb-like protein X [Hylaeus volcanicus]
MTRDGRLLLLLVFLMAYGLFVAESKHRQREDTARDARHRHRHRHESSTGRKNRHDLATGRSSWSRELDYVDDYSLVHRTDRQDEEEEDEEEDDYDYDYDYNARIFYKRSSRLGIRGRTFAPRYPVRYHYRGGYRGTGWHEENDERHRGSPRHGSRNYEPRSERTNRKLGYSRNRDSGYVSEDDVTERETERSRGSNVKNVNKHKIDSKRNRRTDGKNGYREDHSEMWRRFNDKRRKSNSTTEFRLAFDDNKTRDENSHDFEYRTDDVDRANKDDQREMEQEEEEQDDVDDDDDDDDVDDEDNDGEVEDQVWKETVDQVSEELDNDFYESEKKPPLKTYDDIIRRLTADDTTTLKPTIKREYRNIELEEYSRRDAFGNFKYEPKSLSRSIARNKTDGSRYVHSGKKIVENSYGKPFDSLAERKLVKNVSSVAAKMIDRREKKVIPRIDDARLKTKSLEQDYDEYSNNPDNEKEEDLVETGVEGDTGMQADVTNTDYTEDDDEEETTFTASISTSPSSTTSTSTTTTTTSTTSTPRSVVGQNYDYRDSRTYESGTGTRYNGYQSRNDYPPMSAHSVHKWQSLGTRESVKETRSNMQRYNKNGKTAEIREALQHAMKVSREGSCQWPRPRVIPVRDAYPSPSTTYIPHCVILHRCSDDTGCCRLEALTCVPKHSHRVELSFYTTNVGGSNVVEKLSFYNHTECECKERTEYETNNEKPLDQRIYKHYYSSPQPQNMRRPQPRKPCRCPSEFTPRITPEGECQCNCYENHHNCVKIRRGKGYFSLADRLCIQNEECAAPSCEFGEYMRRQGKCPRKKDKFDAIVNYRTNLSHRYRS